MSTTNAVQNGKNEKKGWLRKRALPIAGLLIIVAIIVTAGYLYFTNRGLLDKLQGYGYLGAFVISIILNATLIIPVSNITIIAALGGALPLPYLVGIVGGLGAGIGEMTGYIAGRSGRGLLSKTEIYARVEGWVKRWGWIAVFVLSIVPAAFDVVAIIAGGLRMPIWKFFLACWIGRTIAYIIVATLASMGFKSYTWWLVLGGLFLAALIVLLFVVFKGKKHPDAAA
jgi:uncharacterized membrane protein YdjX (TVP38/TMEM64 family)